MDRQDNETEGDRNRGTDTGCQTDGKISHRTQGTWTDRQRGTETEGQTNGVRQMNRPHA